MRVDDTRRRVTTLIRYAVVFGVLIAAGCTAPSATPLAPSTARATNSVPTPISPTVTSTPTLYPTATSTPTATLPAASASLVLSSLHMVSAASGWATGQSSDKNERGVFRTDDGGAHWQNVSPVNSMGNLPSAFFAGAAQAWVMVPTSGDNSTLDLDVYYTVDKGQTWQNGTAISLVDAAGPGTLDFIDAQNGWMMVGLGAGAGSEAVAILQTIDGGLHWQEASFTGDAASRSTQGSLPFVCIKSGIGFFNDSTGWAAGSCAGGALFFFVTYDGGYTWQHQMLPAPSGYATNIFSQCMCAVNPPQFFGQTGLVTVQIYEQTQAAYLYVTQDGGQTWTPHKLPVNQLMGGLNFTDANNGWITDGNQIYATHDGGQNWAVAGKLPVARENLIGGVDFVNSNDGWVTDGHQLYVTHDGGAAWAAMTPALYGSSLTGTIPTTGGTGGATATPGPIGQGSIPLSPSPQPIKFAPGGTSASVNVNLIPDVPQSFSMQAQAGQQMTITLTGAASLQVYDAQAHALTGIVSQPSELILNLTATGDYRIALRGVGQATLSVTILPLPAASMIVPLPVSSVSLGLLPGDTSTTFTVSLVQGSPQGYVFYVSQGQTLYVSATGSANVGILGPGNVSMATTRTGRRWATHIPATGNYTVVVYGSGQTTVTVYVPPL